MNLDTENGFMDFVRSQPPFPIKEVIPLTPSKLVGPQISN
jgi:hypothetical protein